MKSIQQKIHKYLKTSKGTLSFFGSNQYHDWKIIVWATILGFFAAFIFGIYFYFNIEEWDLFDPSPKVVESKKVDKEVLSKMIKALEGKQARFEELKNNKLKFSDPSF